ncbi:MAG TPA: flagellar hook capping FlgD N-terminal domain-containing protein, partial [Limnochordia bacterium]|nr:flagellar hook capping FlgD N-terminal domain-containing protein [Limnochordia bacterium]
MTVSGVNPTSSGGTPSLSGDASTIAGNFEQFLTLLTTQLQNQNPLDPLDTNQFTQQLVAFSSVEQQLKTNTYLEAMMEANRNQAANEAVAYIGKTVTTSGTTADLAGGSATWSFELPQAAHVEISISD